MEGPAGGKVSIIFHCKTSHRGQYWDGYSGPMNLMLIEAHQLNNSSSVIHAYCYCKESQTQTSPAQCQVLALLSTDTTW